MVEIKNRSIQYYISSLNFQRILINALKHLEERSDIERVMLINEELTNILYKGENEFKMFLNTFNNSMDSLELSILFYKYSMVRI